MKIVAYVLRVFLFPFLFFFYPHLKGDDTVVGYGQRRFGGVGGGRSEEGNTKQRVI